MAVAEDGRQLRVFDALGIEKRAARLRMRHDPAAEALRLERRLHLGFEIARELAGAFRILALGRDRHPAGEIRLEGAAVEMLRGAGDGVGSAHAASLGSSVIEMASDRPLRVTDDARRFDAAARAGFAAAGMKHAARRRCQRIGEREPEAGVGNAEAGLRREHRGEQRPGVGMARRAKQRRTLGGLDDAPEIHDRDAGRDMLDDREIVADEDVGQAEVALEVEQQVENLRLHRDIERRGRLVEHDDLGLDHERAGDGDALALAAAELVGIDVGVARRQADALQHRKGLRAALLRACRCGAPQAAARRWTRRACAD